MCAVFRYSRESKNSDPLWAHVQVNILTPMLADYILPTVAGGLCEDYLVLICPFRTLN